MSTEAWADLPGRLVVISGPSGSGKSTIARRVLSVPGVRAVLSISATTRQPRAGEVDGVDYYFLDREKFEEIRDRGGFLEWAEVHGNLYGTPADPVRERLASGCCVLLEIDVQGGFQVRERVPGVLLVFVNTPSLEVLAARLRARSSEDEPTVQRRLRNALGELERASCYDVQIVNDDLDRAIGELAERLVRHGCGTGG